MPKETPDALPHTDGAGGGGGGGGVVGKWGLTVLSQMIARQLLAVKTQCTSHPPLGRVGGSTGHHSKSLLMGLQSLLSVQSERYSALRSGKLKCAASFLELGVFKKWHNLHHKDHSRWLAGTDESERNTAHTSISSFYNSEGGRGAWWGSWGLL